MARRLTPEERQRRAEEKARKKREREEAREAKKRAKAEEKTRKAREKEERKRQKEIERGRAMKRKPRWLYWLIREQAAKRREHEQYLNAGRVALALGRAVRKIQQKIMAAVGPLVDFAATLKTPEARLVWSREPWTPQDRTQYNWGKRQELAELWEQFPDGIAEQDTDKAARDAKRKTKARRIDHAKAIDKVLDQVTRELAEDKHNAVTSSLERSYRQVYADIARELEENRRAIDADKTGETRMADARDYTDKRRTAPETKIPQSMPRFGAYGESVVFGAPSPDQVKSVLNAKFEGKDYSERIWNDRDKLARELKDMMKAAIINGENSRIVAQKLAQRMGVEFSHAQRLIRTEQSRILNQAHADRMQKEGIKKYRFIAIEDDRTCGRCRRKNRRVYKFSEKKIGQNFPPLHPHCRCTIIANMEPDDDGKDWLDSLLDEWKAGKLTPRGELEALIAKKDGAVTQKEADAAVAAEDAAMKEAEQRQREELNRTRWRIVGEGNATAATRRAAELKEAAKAEREAIQKEKARIDGMKRKFQYYPGGDKIAEAVKKEVGELRKKQAHRTAKRAEITTAKKGIRRTSGRLKAIREEAEVTKRAIIDKAEELAWQNVQDHRATQREMASRINLTEIQAREQVKSYRNVINKALENNYEETKAEVVRYLERLGISDRTEDFFLMYTESVAKRTLPPYIIADEERTQNKAYIAYNSGGMVRINKKRFHWSGHGETIRHEVGHFLDQTILKRKYEYKWKRGAWHLEKVNDPYGIQEDFKADVEALKKRNHKRVFKILDEEYTIDDFKRNAQEYYEVFGKISRAVTRKTREQNEEEYIENERNKGRGLHEIEYRREMNIIANHETSALYDAIMSAAGEAYGDGHGVGYTRKQKGGNVEAIAQIFQMITGLELAKDVFPRAYRKIKTIFEEQGE